jgi:hypothetical protein
MQVNLDEQKEQPQILRLATELLVAPKTGATNSDASLRMTAVSQTQAVWKVASLRPANLRFFTRGSLEFHGSQRSDTDAGRDPD